MAYHKCSLPREEGDQQGGACCLVAAAHGRCCMCFAGDLKCCFMKCPGDQMSQGQAVEMAQHNQWSNASNQQQDEQQTWQSQAMKCSRRPIAKEEEWHQPARLQYMQRASADASDILNCLCGACLGCSPEWPDHAIVEQPLAQSSEQGSWLPQSLFSLALPS